MLATPYSRRLRHIDCSNSPSHFVASQIIDMLRGLELANTSRLRNTSCIVLANTDPGEPRWINLDAITMRYCHCGQCRASFHLVDPKIRPGRLHRLRLVEDGSLEKGDRIDLSMVLVMLDEAGDELGRLRIDSHSGRCGLHPSISIDLS